MQYLQLQQAAVSAVGIVTIISRIQIAHAEPQSERGHCLIGGPSVEGVSGCAGNLGGFVETRHGTRCINQGPFNDFSC